MESARLLSFALCFASFLFSLATCPYSKVEESFQLQATHDLFYHGIRPAIQSIYSSDPPQLPYDHIQFPGVVPRTFAGPIILSSACQLLRLVLLPIADIADSPNVVQFLARFTLMSFALHGFWRMSSTLDKRTKRCSMGNFFLIISACQFHVPFYASRMLPNTFAMVVCLHAYSSWIQGDFVTSAALLVTATATFRCDVLLLLFSVGLSWLLRRELGLWQAIKIGVVTGLLNLLVTVPLDSILWQRLVWPEGQVFYFNTILNKSSEWGVSAWHWYLTSALPKALLLTALFVPLCYLRIPEVLAYAERALKSGTRVVATNIPWIDSTWSPFLWPVIGFISMYSCLGHKEVRFLFPILPLMNLLAAVGMDRIYTTRLPEKENKATVVAAIASFGAVIACVLSIAISVAFVLVSQKNYPGAEALKYLGANAISSATQLVPSKGNRRHVRVFVDVSAAMTGISLFGQRDVEYSNPGVEWNFVKAGYEDDNQLAVDRSFSHLIVENKEAHEDAFELVASIKGAPRLNFLSARIDTSNVLYVMRRKVAS